MFLEAVFRVDRKSESPQQVAEVQVDRDAGEQEYDLQSLLLIGVLLCHATVD